MAEVATRSMPKAEEGYSQRRWQLKDTTGSTPPKHPRLIEQIAKGETLSLPLASRSPLRPLVFLPLTWVILSENLF